MIFLIILNQGADLKREISEVSVTTSSLKTHSWRSELFPEGCKKASGMEYLTVDVIKRIPNKLYPFIQ